MTNQIVVADTIFDGPATSGWNPNQTTPVTTLGGRLMSSAPHTDGLLYLPAGDLVTNSALLLQTRNGKGDWSFNRAAAGAETYYMRGTVNQASITRTGERYVLDLFPNLGNFTESPAAPPKGIQITDLFAVVSFQTALPTTLTLRAATVQYGLEGAAQQAPVVTDILAATAVVPGGLQTAGQYLTVSVPVAAVNQTFAVGDIAMFEFELNIVTAATTTLAIAGIGAHCNFNYN